MITRRLVVPLVVACALVVASPASAMKRLVWVKATKTWTAQAKTHGAAATCALWSADAAKLSCEFKGGGGRWDAVMEPTPDRCVYHVNFSKYYDAITNRRNLIGTQDVPRCSKAWWLKLQSPWTASR